MNSSDNEIYRIEFYGDGLDFAKENEKYIVKYGTHSKSFNQFNPAKEFYDTLKEGELIEKKYDSVLEGKKLIKIDNSRKKIIDFRSDNHSYIFLDNDELNEKLNAISSGVGTIIIYGSVLDHYLGDYIANCFSSTQGSYERTQLFVTELNFSQKCNIVIKDMKAYVNYSYCEIYNFMSKNERENVIKENEFLKEIENQIIDLQKSLEKARTLRNYYAHAEYEYYFKGDLISVSTKGNKRTGIMERCMKYFTEEDIEEDIREIIISINKLDEIKDQIDDHMKPP